MDARPLAAATTLAIALLTGACSGDASPTASGSASPPASPGAVLSIDTGEGLATTLTVDVADDDSERAQGLMGVEELPTDRGMAFVWETPTSTSFWMKDTLIPLSIAFWDEEGRIVGILDMEPCLAEPCPRYDPGVPFVGALETNLGWFEEHGVEVGDHLRLEVGSDG